MEFTNLELAVVESAVAGHQNDLAELNETQLALIGGGSGDTIAF